MFAYCKNVPVVGVDHTGTIMRMAQASCCPSDVSEQIEIATQPVIEYFTPSNLYGATVSGLAITSGASCVALSKGIQNSLRPNNIPIGVFSKQCTNELQQISKFNNTSAQVFNGLAYGVAAIDVCTGIYNNIQNDASTKKIVIDAAVDVAVSGVSIWAAGALGAQIGNAIGTIVPGAGNAIGAAAGFVIGVGLYVATDMIYYNGKTGRTWLKEAANSLW